MKPLLGAVADDFTGATDLANMLARAGMRTVLALGRPEAGDEVPEAEAVVVALKSRTAPVAEAVADSVAAWTWLAEAGAEQCYFKYCSTFDSTPEGNIGPVALALMDETGADFTVYCPAFPEAGRTIYQGHLFVFDRPLHESPLKDHPLTPMTDANLVRWLAPQLGGEEVGLIPFAAVEAGVKGVELAIHQLRARGVRHAVVDALTDRHLEVLGHAVADLALVTAGSGLGLGLPDNFARAGKLAGGPADLLPEIGGLVPDAVRLVLGRDERPGRALGGGGRRDAAPRPAGAGRRAHGRRWRHGHGSRRGSGELPVLVAATQPPDQVRAAQARLGSRARGGAGRGDAGRHRHPCPRRWRAPVHRGWRRDLRRRRRGARRVGAWLAVGPQIAPGVPWCATIGDDPVALALKSGNFGGRDLLCRRAGDGTLAQFSIGRSRQSADRRRSR